MRNCTSGVQNSPISSQSWRFPVLVAQTTVHNASIRETSIRWHTCKYRKSIRWHTCKFISLKFTLFITDNVKLTVCVYFKVSTQLKWAVLLFIVNLWHEILKNLWLSSPVMKSYVHKYTDDLEYEVGLQYHNIELYLSHHLGTLDVLHKCQKYYNAA